MLAGIVVVAIAAIGVGVTAHRDGNPSTTVSESPEIPAPSVGDCIEFSALPSGTRLTTPRSCESVDATLQITQIIRPVDGRAGGTCPESEFFSTLPTYTTGAVRRPTGDLITCYEPNFREGQCYRLGGRAGVDANFEMLRDTQCSRGTFRVLRRVDGNATDAACAGLQGDYTIQNFTRPPRTFCYAENR